MLPGLALLIGALFTQTGCLVSQPHGKGEMRTVVEPTTKRTYHVYLPQSYMQLDPLARKQRRWPLVVTFHGMKPFDHAPWQVHEWEAEADRFGFVVVAPVLNAPDVLAEFPLKRVHPAMKRDEDATLAVIRHVFATTEADPGAVLSTGFSSGGYMAHYMLNRHPEVFTCLAARQANFSTSVQDASLATRSQRTPILIVYTENDMGICKKESQDAITWYERYGFNNVGWVRLKALGHVRTPDLAADFFGRASGVSPLRPPNSLTNRQAMAGNSRGLQFMAGQMGSTRVAAAPTATPSADVTTVRNVPSAGPSQPAAPSPVYAGSVTPPSSNPRIVPDTSPQAAPRREPLPEPRYAMRDQPMDARLASREQLANRPRPARSDDADRRRGREPVFGSWPLDESAQPVMPPRNANANRPAQPAPQPTPSRTAGAAIRGPQNDLFQYDYDSTQPISIRVSSAIGIEPLSLGYWADCPRDWHRTAEFQWTLDGQPIGNGINGQKTIADPGDHTLGLTVTTREGKQYRTGRRIRVLPPTTPTGFTQARR